MLVIFIRVGVVGAVYFLLLLLVLGVIFGVIFGVGVILVVVLVNLSLVVVSSSSLRLLGNRTLCVLLREGFFILLVVLRLPRQILSQILEVVVILVVMRHRIRIRIAVAVAVVKDSVRRRCVVGLTPCCVKRDLEDLVLDLG